MNDDHDNAATDREMLERMKNDESEAMRDYDEGMSDLVYDEDSYAAIRGSMSDLQIANAIIQVIGYDRMLGFMEVLSDRFNDLA